MLPLSKMRKILADQEREKSKDAVRKINQRSKKDIIDTLKELGIDYSVPTPVVVEEETLEVPVKTTNRRKKATPSE